MRILTRPEIHAADSEMVRTMAFHDRLRHSHLLTLLPATSPVPQRLAFDNRVLLTPLDETSHWSVCDQQGRPFPHIELQDLIGCPVTGVGYLHDPENPGCNAIPYVQFLNRVFVRCVSSQGGGQIRHDRPREDAWDLFPQFLLQ